MIKNKIILTLILGIIIIGIGYFGYRYFFNVSFCNIPNCLGNPVSENKLEDVSDWKTYQNEEYGFEFKYDQKKKLNL